MALLKCSSLLVYLEIDEKDPPPFFSSSFLIGLFDAPDAARIDQYSAKAQAWAAKSCLARLITPKPTINISESEATCKAAAYLMDDGERLWVQNVGAEQGFGPTLYAAVLELARARGRLGVCPSVEPGKILEKPKRIWEQFYRGAQYEGKVLTKQVPGHHLEPWLNMSYCLALGASLLDYDRKRHEWKAYDAFWTASNAITSWRDQAFEMARRSVNAHVPRG